ncbi:MAG: hypothetical protein ABJP90_06105 [Paracoccaceae bacterium]
MRREWILDVLSDLKSFARDNNMPALAEQLDDTSIVAMAEIATLKESEHAIGSDGCASAGKYIGGVGTR